LVPVEILLLRWTAIMARNNGGLFSRTTAFGERERTQNSIYSTFYALLGKEVVGGKNS
jgi:hypothetical protein